MAQGDDYDSRIAMVSTWRPSLPEGFGKKRKKPVWRWVFLTLVVLVLVAAVLADHQLRRGLPHIERAADYRPKVITSLVSPSGAIVAEHVGARRRLMPSVHEALERALVARLEPGFDGRAPLGRVDLVRAAYAELRHRPAPPPLSLFVAQSLLTDRASAGLRRGLEERLLAVSLEQALARTELLRLALDELPFGADLHGAEEGALAWFGRTARELDAKQLTALVALAGDRAQQPPDAVSRARSGCGDEALRLLEARIPAETLDHLGAKVVTSCDPAIEKLATTAVRKQRLDRLALDATVVVLRMPAHEIVAVVGEARQAHPFPALVAVPALAAALDGLRFTAASQLGTEGQRHSLRALAATPAELGGALLSAGLNRGALVETAARLGWGTGTEVAEGGQAAATSLEAASVLSTLAADGQRRQLQVLRSIGETPESEGAKALAPVLSPELSWLVGSLLSSGSSARLPGSTAGLASSDGKQAFVATYSPAWVMVVWVGASEAARGRQEAEHAAYAIASELHASLVKSRAATAVTRPARLVSRRLDPRGAIQHSSAQAGTEEWFLPGSLPKEDPLLPPE